MTSASPGSYCLRIRPIHILEEGQGPGTINRQKDGLLSIEAYDGFDAFYDRQSPEEHRKTWPGIGVLNYIPSIDEVKKLLRPVPRNKIYPEFPAGEVTLYKPPGDFDDGALYFKAPTLGRYRDDDNGSNDLAMRLLNETMVHEAILRNPHPNLNGYLGCVEDEGRIVRLAFKMLDESLYERCNFGFSVDFSPKQRVECMDQVEAAAAHLHSLGLAHNDISPTNIMFNKAGQAVLIDLDCCAPLGTPLTKGGWVTGWKDPSDGDGRQFTESSVECDMLAIQEIRIYLDEDAEMWEE